MTQEQIDNFYDMAFSVDPEWMEQHFEKFESLIDTEAIEKAYGEYKLEREYLSSEEYYRTFPGYAENKDVADAMWPYVSKLTFRWNVPVETGPGKGGIAHIAYYNGVEVDTYEAGWGALRKWGEANQAAGDIYYDTIIPTRKIALDKAFEKYSNVSSKAFRAFDMTMIKAWSVRKDFDKYLNTFDPDPYSLKDIPRGNATYDAASELALLGISAAIATSFVKAVGAASAAKLTSVLKKAEGIAKWYNKGRKPGEDKMSWRELLQNDWAQRGKPGTGDKGGWDPTRGFRPGVPGDKGGFGSGPTPAVRQAIERPFRALMNLFQSYDPQGNLLSEETDESLEASIEAALKETESLEDFKKVMDTFMKMMEAEKNKKEQKGMESYKPKFRRNREPLTETRTPKQRRILREIKQPVKVKEAPTKYKMNFSGKYSPQNTPSTTASPETDALVASGNEKGRKWREEDKYWSGYETTERMNVIHDRVGHGSQYWDRMLDEAKEKNNWRSREMQEELNKIAHEKAMLKENPEYRSPFGDGVEVEDTTTKNVQNFERVTKIK